MKYWVNMDKPTKYFLHTDSCPMVLREATAYKGINEQRRDGGWFSFASKKEAIDFFQRKFPDKTVFTHSCVDLHSE